MYKTKLDPIDFHCMRRKNTFCALQKKEIHTGLEVNDEVI